MGVQRVFTPADFELIDIVEQLVEVVEQRAAVAG